MNSTLQSRLQASYQEWVLEKGAPPASVFAFCKQVEIEEKEFYDHFGSLEGLEGSIWGSWMERTLSVLESDGDAASYDARQKLLAFLYTLLEEGKTLRSFLLLRFPRPGKCCSTKSLRQMKDTFHPFAEDWVKQAAAEGFFSQHIRVEDWLPSLMFPKVLGVITFFLEDESAGFEKSDAFVEKAVRLFFDLAQPNLIDSGIDFLRFIVGSRHRSGERKCESSTHSRE